MTTAQLTATPVPGGTRQMLPYLKLAVAILVIAGAIWFIEGGRLSEEPSQASAVTLTGLSGGVTPRIGQPSPGFTLEALNWPTESIDLADLRGRPVLVNFWATWCPPCRGEMPDLEALAQEHRAAGLVVVAINLEEDRATVERYAGALGLSMPIGLDRDGRVSTRFNLTALPTSYFIDREGVVRDLNIGALTSKGLRTKVAKVLS